MSHYEPTVYNPVSGVRTNVSAGHRGGEYVAKLAIDKRTRHDAFALRYRSYVASGYINQNETRLFHDAFDELATASTIVVYSGGRPVASIRACFISRDVPNGSPASQIFPDEVARLLHDCVPDSRGHEGVEFNRLVRSPDAANNQGLVFLCYRLAGYLALLHDFRIMLSCVRQNHVAFYRRLHGTVVSEAKPYPGLTCQMRMLACNRAEYQQIRATMPIIDPHAMAPRTFDGFLDGEPITMPLLPQS